MKLKNRHNLKKSIGLAGIVLGSLFTNTNCIHHSLNSNYQGPKPLPQSIQQEYDYEKKPIELSEENITEKQGYTIKQISFPSTQNILDLEHNITIDYYIPENKKQEKSPVVVVLPVFGKKVGKNKVAEKFAEYVVQQGYYSAIVHRQEQYKELTDFKDIDTILRQMILDNRQAIDWLETQKDIDTEKIGVIGISMGGFKASLLAAIENKRLDATVICLAGSKIWDILTFTRKNNFVKERRRIMEQEHLNPHEFNSRLEQEIQCDPFYYAPYIDASKTLMVISRFDRVVPTRQQKLLRKQIGNPKTIIIPAGHYTSFLLGKYIERKAFKFLEGKFEGED